ncbi:monoglyceride lipase [Plakobranchus ocellatus]|uniref:Monoglyceride lipase n=1 Tax=Plakobranchus ocellatus TaxID=259542 RepID=A0AAV4DJN7_9GAST|nr:monoglyceride lipase [Plakobranchus ocellatus]
MAGKKSSRVIDTFSFDKNRRDSEGSFVNENGLKIFCRYWSIDVSSPRALVFICHGAGEHVGPYTQLAEMLTKENFFVFGHDHQGHGQSEGSRVHIDDLRHYCRDIFAHIDRIKQDFPTLPVFIIGHSMGGAVTILSGLDRPDYFQGVVLIGPVVTSDQDQIGPIKAFFGKIIARLIPQFPVLNLESKYLSRDPKVVEDYENDKLNYLGACKAKWTLCIYHAVLEIESKLSTIEWPFLCMHGECDSLVKCEGSMALYEKAASKDKTLTIYPKAYHQLHLEIEPDGSKARQQIVDWLVNHVPQK